jgi:NADPH-dependent curcumin reductase CurA
MHGVNRQILLVAKPTGVPKESDFALREAPVPELGRGEVLVRSLYLGVDTHVKGRVGMSSGYTKGPQLGDVMTGGVVGTVVASNDPRWAAGDIVEGMLGWQEFAAAPARSLRKIDPEQGPITSALYVLGLPGLTAYFGLLEVGRPQQGETVVVSGAAGAIGSLVGQIARIKRCRAIGIVSSREKADFVTRELGFDGVVNRRETGDFSALLRELAPNGVDVYFDNVGGHTTDEVIRQLGMGARISVCGQIAESNGDDQEMGPRWLGQLVVKQARAEGFLVHQFSNRYDTGLRQLAAWMKEDKLRYREEIIDGLENAPRALIDVLAGRTIGKQLVKVSE